MEKTKKVLIIGFITMFMFLTSFILLVNSLTNYAIVSFTGTLILFVCLCKYIFSKKDIKSIYKKSVKKILKAYDSILIYSDMDFKLDEENIIYVSNFNDLVIAQDSVKKPILYIEEEESSSFLLRNGEEILVYIIKCSDEVVSLVEVKLNEHMEDKKYSKEEKQKILEDLDKTTIIQLKNNKVFKVSPVKDN